MIVYLITNLINQKRYVGITIRKIEQRFQQHCNFKSNKKSGKSAIAEAISLYGKENFKIEQIDTASSIEELYEKEKYWIDKLDTYAKEYNLTLGGDGINGRKSSPETKEKMRQIALKRMQDPKLRQHLSEKTKEYFQKNPEEIEKRRSLQLGYIPSEKTKQKISKANKGKKHKMSVEGSKAISETQKNRIRKPFSEETREIFRYNMTTSNPMNDPEKRKLVSLSKIGRKRIYKEDGSFTMSPYIKN